MKDIKDYEGFYAITSCGKVWSYRSKKFLKPYKTKDGYLKVNLCKDGIGKNFQVHRLVAQAYIPNPQGLETVDHIDNDKSHNYVNNLRWMTREDNIKRAQIKPVYCVELDKTFVSANEAARQLGLSQGNITSCCKGDRHTCGGYHWKYAECEA